MFYKKIDESIFKRHHIKSLIHLKSENLVPLAKEIYHGYITESACQSSKEFIKSHITKAFVYENT